MANAVTDSNDNQAPGDDGLAKSLIDAVKACKDMASQAASKLGDAASDNPLVTSRTKELVQPLLGGDNQDEFKENMLDIKAKMEKFAQLEGPIGGDVTDPNKKYDRSDAWINLATDPNAQHFNNFVSSHDLTLSCPRRAEPSRNVDVLTGIGSSSSAKRPSTKMGLNHTMRYDK
jgi:hypothetical protein